MVAAGEQPILQGFLELRATVGTDCIPCSKWIQPTHCCNARENSTDQHCKRNDRSVGNIVFQDYEEGAKYEVNRILLKVKGNSYLVVICCLEVAITFVFELNLQVLPSSDASTPTGAHLDIVTSFVA